MTSTCACGWRRRRANARSAGRHEPSLSALKSKGPRPRSPAGRGVPPRMAQAADHGAQARLGNVQLLGGPREIPRPRDSDAIPVPRSRRCPDRGMRSGGGLPSTAPPGEDGPPGRPGRPATYGDPQLKLAASLMSPVPL
jgi:hypothetical protein